MDISTLILIFVFGLCLLLNVPIAVAIGVATACTLSVTMPPLPAVTQVAQKVATGLDSFALVAIPFFILP